MQILKNDRTQQIFFFLIGKLHTLHGSWTHNLTPSFHYYGRRKCQLSYSSLVQTQHKLPVEHIHIFLGPKKLLISQQWRYIRNYWSFPTPRIHCARWLKYGSAWELLLNIGPKLWSSALNSLSNLLQQVWMRKRQTAHKHTHRDGEKKERCACVTYRIESATVVFLVVNLTALEGLLEFPTKPSEDSSSLGMSMEDDISHWVAAAYCRHSDFSLSTFCISNSS